jgi:hypothetical protein
MEHPAIQQQQPQQQQSQQQHVVWCGEPCRMHVQAAAGN